MKNIILLAPPASGKGTLAQELIKSYGYVSLSTGDTLREKAKSDQDLSEKLKSGVLIDDETVFEAIADTIKTLDKPYILDGFPRTVNQAQMYDKLLKSLNKEIGVVIYLDVDVQILEDRIISRLSCPKCKRIYNTKNVSLMPKKEGLCDDCNIPLTRRSDDTKEAFWKRYEEYLEKTNPLVNYYQAKNILYKVPAIDSQKTFEEVSSIIKD